MSGQRTSWQRLPRAVETRAVECDVCHTLCEQTYSRLTKDARWLFGHKVCLVRASPAVAR